MIAGDLLTKLLQHNYYAVVITVIITVIITVTPMIVLLFWLVTLY